MKQAQRTCMPKPAARPGRLAMLLVGAASSRSCEGGGFTVSGAGFSISAKGDYTVQAANVGGTIQVRGRYVAFDVVPATFGIANYAFTGAANPEDMTSGRLTPVWQAKTPDHRGLMLAGAVTVERDEEEVEVTRTGPGLTMKIPFPVPAASRLQSPFPPRP